MKILGKIIIIFCFLLGNYVSAQNFNVLVLPADLFSVCDNYYCFDEPSEIFANDIIANFNKSGKIVSPELATVRSKFAADTALKRTAENVLNKYNSNNTIDFIALKKITSAFKTNSVLLISSSVINDNTKRSMWEVLEVSSAFEAVSPYNLETRIVLTDNVNDIVMWSGKYNRNLGDNDGRFWAVSSAQAVSKLNKIKFYSRDIISKNVSQNVILRFYPKTVKPLVKETVNKKEDTEFRPNPLNSTPKIIEDKDYGEIQTDTIYAF